MAKRLAKAAREGEEKIFGGAAADVAHYQLCRKMETYLVPSPISNQILDSFEGYLDNIGAAATQPV